MARNSPRSRHTLSRKLISIRSKGVRVLSENSNKPNSVARLDVRRVRRYGENAVQVRAYVPDSENVWLLHPAHTSDHRMRRIDRNGTFEAILPNDARYHDVDYDIKLQNSQGNLVTIRNSDSSSSTNHLLRTKSSNSAQNNLMPTNQVTPLLNETDLHLFGEGNYEKAYNKMGAHQRNVDGVNGVNFAAWAPNAKEVQIIGDFNGWTGENHLLQPVGSSGIWETFIPNLSFIKSNPNF